jgi:hypothetical protein
MPFDREAQQITYRCQRFTAQVNDRLVGLLDTERLECRLNLSQPDDSLEEILPAFDRASVPCALQPD